MRQRAGVRAAALLAPPLGWLGVVYLGSLVVLLIAAFWSLDPFSGVLVKSFSLDNFKTIVDQSVCVAERDLARQVAMRGSS